MKLTILKAPLVVVAAVAVLAACGERPPMESTQTGYRGTGMVTITNPRIQAELQARNVPPESPPMIEGGDGPLAKDVYQNVQVLTDLTVTEFIRQMTAQANWIAPNEQCAYCHNLENFASDEKYTKVVARRMIQMTRDINVNWQQHVAQTGVTCYTCHRGEPVPQYAWFGNPGPAARGLTASTQGQNRPAANVNLSSLPYDPYTPYLLGDADIRVQTRTALPTPNPYDTKATEYTYALMMHTSQALGVNCEYCHNSRAWASWEQSNPQRVVAWHAIRMVRELNNAYLVPLTGTFPDNRLGPTGDVAKVNCMTCHQGQPKPLNGVSMLAQHPELARLPAVATTATGTLPDSPAAAELEAAGAARDAAAAKAMATTSEGA
jgi:photosynthetic reaction center cytochrome c subunit